MSFEFHSFQLLPIILQIQILVHAGEDEFRWLSNMEELIYIFGFKSSFRQRMHEERIRYWYPSLLQFKITGINWSQFYVSIRYIIRGLNIGFDLLIKNENLSLIEYKIIQFLRPNEFKEYQQSLIDESVYQNRIDIMDWLQKIPSDYYIFLAVQLGNFDVLNYLHEEGFEFTEYHMQNLERGSELYEWFSQRNYIPHNIWDDVHHL